ncbi:MAG: phosphate ABC transporter permease subunit PstC [Spirochaetales bacterium]|nr:phosphate ABC transporter permease subunit PstC [Spirochaetales bacterium]
MKQDYRAIYELIIKILLLLCACVSVLAVVLITLFIFQSGLPLFTKVSPVEFLTSTYWKPADETNPGFGILAFIVGSFYVTVIALLIAVPIGLFCAVFLSEFAKGKPAQLLRRAVEILAGIPSVVYGLFGVVIICGLVREIFGGTGYSVLSGSIILAIMILPTIITISEISIRSVPEEYRAGSLATGATHWQTIVRVILPSAKSGIIASIVLGTGRAIGETMAVLMVAGNAPIMPEGLTSMVRTLTMNIVTDMSYATGDHRTALFTTGIVLFLFIMTLNIIIYAITRKSRIQEE